MGFTKALEIGKDECEGVVDVVRKASGKASDGAKSILGDAGPNHRGGSARRSARRDTWAERGLHLDDDRVAPVPDRHDRRCGQQSKRAVLLLDPIGARLGLVGNRILERFANQIFVIDPEQRACRGIRKKDATSRIDDHDPVGCAGEQQAALRLDAMSLSQLHEQPAQLVLAVDRLLKPCNV